jgi:hypothetical protein
MRVFRSALFVGLFSSLLTASVAVAASTMAGETFTGTWTISSVDLVPAVTANCLDPVSATVKYLSAPGIGSTAVAAGPYPGFYSESGIVTVTNSVITAWTATWSVAGTADGQPYVSGTKTLSVAGTGPFICLNFAAGTLNATLSYTADGAPASPPLGTPAFVGPATGLATASLTFNTTALGDPPTAGTASGTFTESFLGSPPPPPPTVGCNTDGNSTGNDNCEQEGKN